MTQRYTTYSAFFDFYLAEHSQPLTRALHYAASTCGIAALIATVVTGKLLWIPAGLVAAFLQHEREAVLGHMHMLEEEASPFKKVAPE